MPDKYLCEVVRNKRLCDGVFAITIESEAIADEALAGQFLHIKCGSERLLRRPISICSVRGGEIDFVFEVKGEGTSWLSMRMAGEKLDILGPLGNGFSMPEGNIITVGGGIGVPPMLFTAEETFGSVTALLGFRSEDKIILKDEFEAICEKVIITTDDGSYGIHGAVTAPLSDFLENGKFDGVLACGPRAMLYAVAKACRTYGVSCQVSLEERMGCGVGACLVCACATVSGGIPAMSRVCMDGPVFEASEVVW